MKKILILILIFFYTVCSAQNFNGDYRSYKTSFIDNQNKENNFKKETENRILVLINKDNNGGSIVFQDPKFPDKTIFYQVIKNLGEIKTKDITIYMYKVKSENMINEMETTIGFYLKNDKKLRLIIDTNRFSQVFYNLIKQE